MSRPSSAWSTALLLITAVLCSAPAIAFGAGVNHRHKAHKHHTHRGHRRTHGAKHPNKRHKPRKRIQVRRRPSPTKRKPGPGITPTTPTTTPTTVNPPPTTAAPVAPSTTTTPTGTSGEPMPTGSIAGWKEVFSDDFTESSLNQSVWNIYWGQPGGDPGGWWNTNHATLGGGILDLRGYQDTSQGGPAGSWQTAGVAQRASRTYGKWEVRARMDEGKGIAPVLLLWPASQNWPADGEIDFAEDGGQDPRSTSWMTVHYYGACGSDHDCTTSHATSVDWSQWHTYGVEWTPGKVVFTLDGNDVAAVTSNVPADPMYLAMQDQMEGSQICGGWEACPDASTPSEVDFDIDWVVEYAPAG